MKNLTSRRVPPKNKIQLSQILSFQPRNQQSNKSANLETPSQTSNILKKLKHKWMMDKIVTKVKSMNPTRNQKSTNIKQQWQKQNDVISEIGDSSQYLLKKSSKIYALFRFLFLVYAAIICWYLTVISVYEIISVEQSLFYIWLIFLLSQISVSLNTIRIIQNRQISTRLQIFKYYVKYQMYLDIICILEIIFFDKQIVKQVKLIIQIITIIALIIKIKSHIAVVKPFIHDSNFNKHFTLISLFIYLLIAGHTFGLIMFLASKYNSEKNWLHYINISNNKWSSMYIYSIYWAFTTIVTVGYGDIIPQNQCQIIVVIFVQIFGTAIFGYMINIIGMAMSQIKKQKQILQQQLGIASKIAKCFSLKEDITFRLKEFLKNNQKVYTTFSIAQQKRILDKLNPDLKTQILQQTNTKVIKKCVFLLTYFSKPFQDKIALKLVKRILQPNQLFIIANQKDISLYIIQQGSVDILYKKYSKNKVIIKKVKRIQQNNKQNSVGNNIYGYSQIILGQKLSMNAMSKTFTVVYELAYKDFIEAIQASPLDYETVCELKQKYLDKQILQSIQNPSITNFKQHYIPNSFLIIKKVIGQNNKRKIFRRKLIKCNSRNILCNGINLLNRHSNSIHSKNSILIGHIYKMQQAARQFQKNTEGSVVNIRSQNSLRTSFYEIQNHNIQDKDIQFFMYGFESLKNYTNYFNSYNVQLILNKYKSIHEKKEQNKIQLDIQ